MINGTAVVVDSSAYLPREVVERYGAIVVPLTVLIDGDEYLEFEQCGADDFYQRLSAGARVSTSQPSPGRFLAAYQRAARLGAERIFSIHISSALSGTMNSARLAAADSPIPVHLVDTGQASFIEGLCAWEAIETLSAGGSLEEADAAAMRAGAACGNVFIVKGLELLEQGGRMRHADAEAAAAALGVPVLALIDGAIKPVQSVATVEAALDAIVGHVEAAMAANPGKQFRIGVGNGAYDEVAARLEDRIRALPQAAEVMQYTIGPVIGAHTGAGCTGAVFLPRPV